MIYKKLFEIQKMMLTFQKTKENPFFKSKYLPLDELLKKLLPILAEHEILLYHYTKDNTVVTSIKDMGKTAGEEIKSEFPIQLTKPQEVGSTITYAKRYNIGQIFNIVIDEDDDGNKASVVKPKTSPFEQAMEKIKSEKDKKVLEDWKKKIEKSTLYDEAEKFELIAAINEK